MKGDKLFLLMDKRNTEQHTHASKHPALLGTRAAVSLPVLTQSSLKLMLSSKITQRKSVLALNPTVFCFVLNQPPLFHFSIIPMYLQREQIIQVTWREENTILKFPFPFFPSFILILVLPLKYTRTIKTHLKMLIYLRHTQRLSHKRLQLQDITVVLRQLLCFQMIQYYIIGKSKQKCTAMCV